MSEVKKVFLGHSNDPFANKFKGIFKQLEILKLKILKPVFNRLKSAKITPNQITYLALAIGLASLYFLYIGKIKWFTLLVLINLGLDIIDGAYARYLKKDSRYGTFVDFICDQSFILLVYLVVLIKGYINPVWLGLTIGLYLYHELLYFILKETGNAKVPIHTAFLILFAPVFNRYTEILILINITTLYGIARAWFYFICANKHRRTKK